MKFPELNPPSRSTSADEEGWLYFQLLSSCAKASVDRVAEQWVQGLPWGSYH